MNRYIKHNQELYERFKGVIDEPKRWYGIVSHFECVECGGYCSYGNFVFYNKDPKRVKCYKCQNK